MSIHLLIFYPHLVNICLTSELVPEKYESYGISYDILFISVLVINRVKENVPSLNVLLTTAVVELA